MNLFVSFLFGHVSDTMIKQAKKPQEKVSQKQQDCWNTYNFPHLIGFQVPSDETKTRQGAEKVAGFGVWSPQKKKRPNKRFL